MDVSFRELKLELGDKIRSLSRLTESANIDKTIIFVLSPFPYLGFEHLY